MNCDMGRCSLCGWSGKVSECETEWESDGWETSRYQVHLCPACDDGFIDDYWPSDVQLLVEERTTEKAWLLLIKKIMNNNGWFFYRDIKQMWEHRFTKEELQLIKTALEMEENLK